MLVGVGLSFDAVDNLGAARKRGLMRARPAKKSHKKTHGKSKSARRGGGSDGSIF
jgi:hypothetical protein